LPDPDPAARFASLTPRPDGGGSAEVLQPSDMELPPSFPPHRGAGDTAARLA